MRGFRWGHIGEEHSWERLESDSSGKGVVRLLREQFEYHVPELGSHGPVWTQLGDERLEMPWDRSPDTVQTLGELSSLLRSRRDELRRRSSPQSLPPELKRLDRAARKLLEITEHLHQRGWGLGCLTLDNVLLTTDSDEEIRVVLPDLGFAKHSESNLRPEWIKALERRRGEAWPDPLTANSVLQRGAGAVEDFDPLPDVRALGRLFILALSGKPAEEVSALIQARGREAREFYAPVWTTLREAAHGELKTAAELATRLRDDATPLSQHFQAWRRPSGPRSAGRFVAFALLALAMVGASVGYMTRDRWWSKCGEIQLTGDSLLDLQQAKSKLGEAAPDAQAAITAMAMDITLDRNADLAAKEVELKSEILGTFLDKWQNRVLGILEGDAQDPVKRVAVVKDVKTLRDELVLLKQKLTTVHEGTELLKRVEKCLQQFDQHLAPQLGVSL